MLHQSRSANVRRPSKQLNIDPLVLMHFLMDHEVTINGAWCRKLSGGPNATLQDLVDAAGEHQAGLMSGIEVTSTTVSQVAVPHIPRKLLSLRAANLSSYIVKPHDQIRFSQVYTSIGAGSVVIQGEVRSPENTRSNVASDCQNFAPGGAIRSGLSVWHGVFTQIGCRD